MKIELGNSATLKWNLVIILQSNTRFIISSYVQLKKTELTQRNKLIGLSHSWGNRKPVLVQYVHLDFSNQNTLKNPLPRSKEVSEKRNYANGIYNFHTIYKETSQLTHHILEVKLDL